MEEIYDDLIAAIGNADDDYETNSEDEEKQRKRDERRRQRLKCRQRMAEKEQVKLCNSNSEQQMLAEAFYSNNASLKPFVLPMVGKIAAAQFKQPKVAPPFDHKSYRAHLCHVRSPFEIYLRSEAQQLVFDEMTRALEDIYKGMLSEFQINHLSLHGDLSNMILRPCVFFDTERNMWLRAKILKALPGKIKLFLIDFGHSQSARDLRNIFPLIDEFADSPIVYRCSFFDASPQVAADIPQLECNHLRHLLQGATATSASWLNVTFLKRAEQLPFTVVLEYVCKVDQTDVLMLRVFLDRVKSGGAGDGFRQQQRANGSGGGVAQSHVGKSIEQMVKEMLPNVIGTFNNKSSFLSNNGSTSGRESTADRPTNSKQEEVAATGASRGLAARSAYIQANDGVIDPIGISADNSRDSTSADTFQPSSFAAATAATTSSTNEDLGAFGNQNTEQIFYTSNLSSGPVVVKKLSDFSCDLDAALNGYNFVDYYEERKKVKKMVAQFRREAQQSSLHPPSKDQKISVGKVNDWLSLANDDANIDEEIFEQKKVIYTPLDVDVDSEFHPEDFVNIQPHSITPNFDIIPQDEQALYDFDYNFRQDNLSPFEHHVDSWLPKSTHEVIPDGLFADNRFMLEYPTQAHPPIYKVTMVSLTHAERPTEFYVQTEQYKSIFEVLSTRLQADYSQGRCRQYGTLPSATLGMPCVIAHQGQGNHVPSWFRCQVESVLPDGRVVVLFVDFGSRELCKLDQLYPLLNTYNMSPLVYRCHLSGFETENESAYVQQFKEYLWARNSREFACLFLNELSPYKCVLFDDFLSQVQQVKTVFEKIHQQ